DQGVRRTWPPDGGLCRVVGLRGHAQGDHQHREANLMARTPGWAIYTDLSGVVEMSHGRFATELEAISALIASSSKATRPRSSTRSPRRKPGAVGSTGGKPDGHKPQDRRAGEPRTPAP